MNIITLDFESFYSDQYGFKKLTTEEYVRGSEFQVIGVGIGDGNNEIIWVSGSHEELYKALSKYDWDNTMLLCHNTQFDGAILSWVYGLNAAVYLDTLSMARALHGVDAGGSLAALAERYNLGKKGTEVNDAKGMRREDFTPEALATYGGYCKNDVALTRALFDKLVTGFSMNELRLIDMTLRMFIHPVLEVDDALLVSRLEDIRAEKQTLLGSLKTALCCADEEAVRKKLASNKQFAALLMESGVTPPKKISPATGKETFALAKNDVGFIELTEHEDPHIQQLCAVRLGTKSTLEESRINRFIDIGARNRGKIPVPLKYYGAHTGRWSGIDKVNFQNLPSRDKKKKALKNAIIAPKGHVIINCDSSQIEARVLVWLAGQTEVVEQFADGRDVYCEFASKVYKRHITKADPVERFVGKTCSLGLGYGTGWAKLQHTLKTTPPGADLNDSECQNLVALYRSFNDKVVGLWRDCDSVLGDLAAWPKGKKPYFLGEHGVLLVTPEGIQLPNGLYIRYQGLKWDTSEVKGKYVYKSRKGPVSIWGGAVTENVVQALARIIVGEQMLKMMDTYRPVLTVHDAAVIVSPEHEKDQAMEFVTSIMSTPPDWCKTLPVACEAKFSESYGGC